MQVSFVYPSSGQATGGEVVMYELANALSRRGVEVHFLHGPAWPTRISRVDELPAICHAASVHHHVVDALDQPALPASDVVFAPDVDRTLGLPATLIQGHRMLSEEWEAKSFRDPGLRVCVASWLRRIGETYGVDPACMVHVPPGIDHDVFRPPSADALRPIDVSVLFHPFREKGWKTAEATLALLRERRPDLRCVVFGRRDPRPLPPGVEFVDSPDHRRLVDEIYGRTRIFVQASRNEGFGLTALEAMACGAALVSTDCGGSQDYALAGETAVVVPVEDPDALARAVADLSDDEARRRRYAAAGMAHARTFTWDASGERLERALAAYLDDPAPFLAPPGPDRPELRQPDGRPNAAGSAR